MRVRAALENGAEKIDLFFMVGLPHQTYRDALKNVEFCETIYNAVGGDPRVTYFIAPMAPFLDPASTAFEYPERYGYRKLFENFEDYRQALLQPSWKYTLNYETDAMTRDDIVRATYDSARMLNAFKFRHHLIDEEVYRQVDQRITEAVGYLQAVDQILQGPLEQRQVLLGDLRDRIASANGAEICGDRELRWKVRHNYAGPLSLLWVGFTLLAGEIWREAQLTGRRLLNAEERP